MTTFANINNNKVLFTYSNGNETSKRFQIHCHNIFELYYFIEGDVDFMVEGKVFHPTPRSLLLLSPHVFHGVRVNSEESYIRYVIEFHPDLINLERRNLLLSIFPDVKKFSQKEVYYEHTDYFHLHSFFEAIVECSKQQATTCEQLLPIYLEALLAQLNIMCRTLSPTKIENNTTSIISDIITYLNDQLTESISLDMISEKFYISKHYLNRIFRKATGTTIIDYLIYKRVIYAQQLLMNGSAAIDAAVLSGFHDYSTFYRAYRRILGHTPSKDLF